MGKGTGQEPVDPALLAGAAADRSFVRVKRRRDDSIDGFIVGVTPGWTAIAVLADTIDLDGYALIRTPSVRRLKHLERQAEFVREVLQARDQWPPKTLNPFEADNDESLIRGLSTTFPLLSVYTERQHPDECYIGRPLDVTPDALTLEEVDTSGRWLEQPTSYPLAKVTRIGVAGRYEEALQTVAGAQLDRRSAAAADQQQPAPR